MRRQSCAPPELVAQAFRGAIEVDASFTPAHLNLGTLYASQGEKEAAAARLAAEQETARVWQSLHSSASEGLDAEASAKMHKFTSRLETWHGERMAMFDEDAEVDPLR